MLCGINGVINILKIYEKVQLTNRFIYWDNIICFILQKKDKENTCTLNELSLTGSCKVESVKYKATLTYPETDSTSLFLMAAN
jgi:hypothetical protein